MSSHIIITDKFPASDASGVYINDVVWAQFSEPLNTTTANYYNFTVHERDTYEPVEGSVELQSVSGTFDNSIIVFVPTNGFVRNTRYAALASTAIASADSLRVLDYDYTWYFTTGASAATGNIGDSVYDLDPSGFTLSGAVATGPSVSSTGIPLAVVSTTPADYGTNVALNTPHIAIEFNDAIPSGVDLYNYIKLTSKHILS